jgi:hypothetical protein
MINATLMKTVALAALLSMASACQAADLTVGKRLSTQELAQYASTPTVQIESQSFKVLSSGTRTKAAGAASSAVTQVVNERGVVGESRKRTWQRKQMRLQCGQLGALHNQFDVPPKRADAGRQRREHVDGGSARIAQVEADGSHTGRVHFGKLCLRHGRIDHRNTARTRPETLERIQRATVVRSVRRRRDHHVALHA